jgi:thiol-disulfide isomerase/thioredoxin
VKKMSALLVFASLTLAQSGCRQPSPPAEVGDTNPLLGNPLKPFVTVDPDGNKIDLSDHLGKNVILLDFWATWCIPCLMAMPEVQQVAKDFKDRGLVFYAVNVGEDPDTVKQFLAQNKFDIPVAMDFDGKIQNMYHADNLPHTIVIGKDGRLQVDHMGYWQGFGEELREQVKALLDGQDLTGGAVN